MLNPGKKQKIPFVTQKLSTKKGPVLSVTDYMKIHSDQIREFVPDVYRVLGTDGFGRSDTRSNLRQFFEISREFIVLSSLKHLLDKKQIKEKILTDAIQDLGLDSEKPNPLSV